MLVQSASVQIPNQGGCESEQNGWGQSFCSEMFSLHSCSGKGVDMWLLKKSWKVMHNWPHTTPNKDSNFPTYLKQMNQMVATRTFVGVTSKPRRPTWQKLKLQPSATSPRHCCKGIQICCCWGKKNSSAVVFLLRQYSEAAFDAIFSNPTSEQPMDKRTPSSPTGPLW